MATKVEIIKFEVLHYKSDTSDKLYELRLLRDGAHYAVIAAYGRRGSVLKEITKVATSRREEALAVFDAARTEKINKGYRAVTNKNKAQLKKPEASMPPEPQLDRELIFGEL